MPVGTLSQTPTAGNDEVLKTLQYLVALPLGRRGATKKEIAAALNPNGHWGMHPAARTVLEAEVATVLTALEVHSPAWVADDGAGTPRYRLTRNGVLAARRARPYSLRP